MRTTKIKIKNLFGIMEQNLDGKSIEVTGDNGTGKTSIIDSIRYALTNQSNRDYIIKQGENQGEILIETDTGLHIERKKCTEQSDYKSIKENGRDVMSPESFLQQLFTPLQLDPVAFTQMTKKEQNRIILDLIEFDWDLKWIKSKFGELPEEVNYQQNILQVLHDIQSESGIYFQKRQDINRDLRNKLAFIEDIAKDIPNGYQAKKWEDFDLGGMYKQIEKIKFENNKIERGRMVKSNYRDKLRGLEAEKEISVSAVERTISSERTGLKSTIERLKAEVKACEDTLLKLDEKQADKVKIAEIEFEKSLEKLEQGLSEADNYAEKELQDTAVLESNVAEAERMKNHLNEYRRMISMQSEVESLTTESNECTRKIELARNLPGEILQTAKIPIDGFSIDNGSPLINGLPVSNLSEGEQLNLCVDVALSKPNSLQIILLDGVEKLSDKNRIKLYQKCKEKGLQFIATRTTNDYELQINYL